MEGGGEGEVEGCGEGEGLQGGRVTPARIVSCPQETVLGRWDREWKALESTVAGPRGAAFGRTLKTSTNSVR